MFYLIVAGLGGANVLYNLTRWDEKKFGHGAEVLMFWKWWSLGLVWYGGLLAAFFVGWWFVPKHKVSFWPYADLVVSGVAIGHALGRLGCFSAGCCFGNPASEGFPFTVHFPPGSPRGTSTSRMASSRARRRSQRPSTRRSSSNRSKRPASSW